MALTATLYQLTVDLSDVDRGVYETLDLRVARHPSESAEYMLARVLAYCLEYAPGVAFTEGVSSGDEPAVVVRDLTGRLTAWIEVGLPSAERLHRGHKLAGRAAVYTHRDVRQWLGQVQGARIHRAGDIRVVAFDPPAIEAAAAALERRSAVTLSVVDAQLFLGIGEAQWTLPLVPTRLALTALRQHRRICSVTKCLRDRAGDNRRAVLPYGHQPGAPPGQAESHDPRVARDCPPARGVAGDRLFVGRPRRNTDPADARGRGARPASYGESPTRRRARSSR